jgi:hypothetical protein
LRRALEAADIDFLEGVSALHLQRLSFARDGNSRSTLPHSGSPLGFTTVMRIDMSLLSGT